MTVNLTANLDIHDTEIDKIAKGPLAYMQSRQSQYTDLEDFRQRVVDKFAEIGFGVTVKCYETDVNDLYAFDIEINRRLRGEFDPNQQVHEVVHNVLDLPDDRGKGWISSSEGMRAAEAQAKDHRH